MIASCVSPTLIAIANQPVQENLDVLPAADNFLSDQDHAFILDNADISFAYIPQNIKVTINTLRSHFTELDALAEAPSCLNEQTNIMPYDAINTYIVRLIKILEAADTEKQSSIAVYLNMIRAYAQDLQSGDARITLEEFTTEDGAQVRGRCKTVCNLWVRCSLNTCSLTVSGDATICGDLTVCGTINGSSGGSTNLNFITDGGTAIPTLNTLKVLGGSNITTNGAGDTVTVKLNDNVSLAGSLLAAGSIASGGSMTAGTGLTITAGGLNVLAGGITSTGTTTLNSLTAGALTTNNSGVVSSSAGTPGQILIGQGATNPLFGNLTSTNGTIDITNPSATTINLENADPAFFGNVCRVDKVFGDDSTGERNGPPFLTITAAMAATMPGDVVWIFPGTYNESFTIEDNVSVVGLSSGGASDGGVRIELLGVTGNTNLITMGDSSSLENVSLNLTSTASVTLQGIVFPGAATTTAVVKNVQINVESTAGNTTLYGIHPTGSGGSPTPDFYALRESTVSVIATGGTQIARGILVDSANSFNVRDSNIMASSPVPAGSGIGVQTSLAGASCTILASSVSGSTADISQGSGVTNLGTITLTGTKLVNSNANGLQFTSTSPTPILAWGVIGALTAAPAIRYMFPGTVLVANISLTEAPITQIRIPHACIIKTLSVTTAGVAATSATTITVRKGSLGAGAATSLVVTLPAASLFANNVINSVSFAAGEYLSIEYATGAVVTPTSLLVTVELY